MKKLSLLVMAAGMAMLSNVAAPAYAADLYVRGEVTDWNKCDDSNKMTEENGVYTWSTANLPAGKGFKIAEATWNDNQWSSKNSKMVVDTDYTCTSCNYEGGEMKVATDIKNATITFTFATKTLRITGEGGEVVVVPVGTLKHFVKGPAVGSWDNSKEMTFADGVYTYAATFKEGEFGVYSVNADGSQNTFFHAGSEKNITEANKAYACGENGNFVNKLAGEYTLVFDPTAETIMFKSDAGNQGGGDDPIVTPPTPVENGTFYLRGGFTGEDWAVNENYKFTYANGVYTLTVAELKGGADFKVADANWDTPYSSENKSMELGVSYKLNDSKDAGNMALKADAKNVTLTFDQVNKTLVISAEGADEPIVTPPTPSTDVWCIHGQIATGEWSDIALVENDGKWSYTGAVVAGEFGFKKNGNWAFGGAVNATEAEVVYTVQNGGANSKSTIEGTYTVTFDPAAMTIVWTPFQGEIVETVSYAIKGNIFGDPNWSSKEMTFDSNANVWTLETKVIDGEFGIQELVNGVQKGWHQFDGSATQEVEHNVAYATTGMGGEHFALKNVDADAVYTFTFDPEKKELTVSGTTGVATVEAENGAAVYYNLQGVRVANPEKGLFIVVKGNKATKVVL